MRKWKVERKRLKTLHFVRQEFEKLLKENNIDSFSLDTRVIITHILDIEYIEYVLEKDRIITTNEYNEILKMMTLRLSRMPISQIIGDKEFWSINFNVTKDTLTPRPDSETLIAAAIKEFDNPNSPLNILDLGTGTGCLLLALLSEFPKARGLGVDLSPAALDVARHNAQMLGLMNRAEFQISNWTKDIVGNNKFDLIVCNPPYIGLDEKETLSPEVRDHEPAIALFSGLDGLDDYRTLAGELKCYIKDGGIIVLEIGYKQAKKVKKIFNNSGYNDICVKKDLGERDRCLLIKN
ncbi:MAG: peptide chain release factor N(5)-glutamine methyltransferase [Proteobacteria bacterium]|nr:peptide chain release factor N(5)-glutamine methyltransferase [Pseudomonadota bacterium]